MNPFCYSLDFEWAVGVTRWGMKACGVWPNSEQPMWQRQLTSARVMAASLLLIFVTTIPTTLAMTRVWGDMTLIIDNFIINFPYFTAVVKLVVLWYKDEELDFLFNEIREHWTTSKPDVERCLMVKNAKLARFVTILLYVLIAMVMTLHHLPFWVAGLIPRTRSNFTDPDHRALVMQTVYFHDISHSPAFEITAALQTVSTLIAGSSYTVVDCVFVMLIAHIRGQLELLALQMESMCDNYRELIKRDPQGFTKIVGSIMRIHQRIIRFVETVENVFSMMILQQFTAFAVIFAVTGFQLISIFVGDVQSSLSSMSFAIMYFLCTLSSIFMYSVAGEFLINSSTAVAYAAYESSWYDLTKRDMSLLIILIVRAQKSLAISVGKFAPVSLRTFSALINTSGGYLSVLLAMKS